MDITNVFDHSKVDKFCKLVQELEQSVCLRSKKVSELKKYLETVTDGFKHNISYSMGDVS